MSDVGAEVPQIKPVREQLFAEGSKHEGSATAGAVMALFEAKVHAVKAEKPDEVGTLAAEVDVLSDASRALVMGMMEIGEGWDEAFELTQKELIEKAGMSDSEDMSQVLVLSDLRKAINEARKQEAHDFMVKESLKNVAPAVMEYGRVVATKALMAGDEPPEFDNYDELTMRTARELLDRSGLSGNGGLNDHLTKQGDLPIEKKTELLRGFAEVQVGRFVRGKSVKVEKVGKEGGVVVDTLQVSEWPERVDRTIVAAGLLGVTEVFLNEVSGTGPAMGDVLEAVTKPLPDKEQVVSRLAATGGRQELGERLGMAVRALAEAKVTEPATYSLIVAGIPDTDVTKVLDLMASKRLEEDKLDDDVRQRLVGMRLLGHEKILTEEDKESLIEQFGQEKYHEVIEQKQEQEKAHREEEERVFTEKVRVVVDKKYGVKGESNTYDLDYVGKMLEEARKGEWGDVRMASEWMMKQGVQTEMLTQLAMKARKQIIAEGGDMQAQQSRLDKLVQVMGALDKGSLDAYRYTGDNRDLFSTTLDNLVGKDSVLEKLAYKSLWVRSVIDARDVSRFQREVGNLWRATGPLELRGELVDLYNTAAQMVAEGDVHLTRSLGVYPYDSHMLMYDIGMVNEIANLRFGEAVGSMYKAIQPGGRNVSRGEHIRDGQRLRGLWRRKSRRAEGDAYAEQVMKFKDEGKSQKDERLAKDWVQEQLAPTVEVMAKMTAVKNLESSLRILEGGTAQGGREDFLARQIMSEKRIGDDSPYWRRVKGVEVASMVKHDRVEEFVTGAQKWEGVKKDVNAGLEKIKKLEKERDGLGKIDIFGRKRVEDSMRKELKSIAELLGWQGDLGDLLGAQGALERAERRYDEAQVSRIQKAAVPIDWSQEALKFVQDHIIVSSEGVVSLVYSTENKQGRLDEKLISLDKLRWGRADATVLEALATEWQAMVAKTGVDVRDKIDRTASERSYAGDLYDRVKQAKKELGNMIMGESPEERRKALLDGLQQILSPKVRERIEALQADLGQVDVDTLPKALKDELLRVNVSFKSS